jgi:hypothetical protein
MDSEDMMETPIDHIQGDGDDDEIAKMILSELEKQKKEKDEITHLEQSLDNENKQRHPQHHLQPQIQPQVQNQHFEIQPPVQVEQPTEELINPINKDILIIAVLVFILSQPSIQNFIPKTNPIIKTLLISGLAAGGFYLYKKGNF